MVDRVIYSLLIKKNKSQINFALSFTINYWLRSGKLNNPPPLTPIPLLSSPALPAGRIFLLIVRHSVASFS